MHRYSQSGPQLFDSSLFKDCKRVVSLIGKVSGQMNVIYRILFVLVPLCGYRGKFAHYAKVDLLEIALDFIWIFVIRTSFLLRFYLGGES